jgi:uncharacterized membrane protein YuzA (DUF378 family)
MKGIDIVTRVLLIVGGLNWGLVGALFGAGSVLANIVYILVGLSALVQAALLALPKSRSVAAAH